MKHIAAVVRPSARHTACTLEQLSAQDHGVEDLACLAHLHNLAVASLSSVAF